MTWIALSGMMGAGKSTVARVVAARLGVEAVDVDARIEATAGKPIAAIFRDEGERAFREIEAATIARVLDARPDGVMALGGGAVLRDATRRRLVEEATLVTLTAPVDELVRRAAGPARPLLDVDDAAPVVRALLEERAAAYAECHATIDTGGIAPDEVATRVIDVARRAPVAVPLGVRTYRVEIGRGTRARLPSLLRARVPGEVLVRVTDANVDACWPMREGLDDWRVASVVLEPGEAHKDVRAVERVWDAALAAGIDRRGAVVAIGGGVVGDLAGFAAATIMRGIRFVQVPTSLLAMVDASVGGKTGFDRPEGKNLVGAFHQPEGVLCDVETLATLPDEELSAGLAEVVKAAWLDSEAAVAALESDAAALVARDEAALERAIRMAVRLKARVVAADEREAGARRTLNLGHTVGHAIEAASGYAMRHGEAVALGMVAAFRVAEALGEPDAVEHGARAERLLDALGLPTALDAHVTADTAGYFAMDKKRVGEGVAFIVPGAPGAVRVERLGFEAVRAAVRLP